MDEFHMLPFEQGWQDSIRFKRGRTKVLYFDEISLQLYSYAKKFI